MKELTRAEEQIMQILWKIEKGFVKNILDHIEDPKPAYNTVSTIVRILEKKGFVGYNTMGKSHEYYPLISKDDYRKFSLKSLIAGYFDGSFQKMVFFFANENELSNKELEEVKKELDQIITNKDQKP